MWRDLVAGLFEDAAFGEPAEPADLTRLEAALGLALPDDLRGCLREANGVTGYYGSPLVWSTDEIIEQNELFRGASGFEELYMPFDCLLFFGASANGDQFAYRVLGGQIRSTSWVFKWDHESDNREWFARDLEDYLRRSKPDGG